MKNMAKDLAIALAIGVCLRIFFINMVHVDGHSMDPTLHDGQYLLAEKVSLWFGQYPDYKDIVIVTDVDIPNEENGRLIKRVIGKPGDTVEVKKGVLYLNGKKQKESYIAEKMNNDFPKTKIKKGEVFVMGDNRNYSSDSRVFGAFKLEQIEASILFKK